VETLLPIVERGLILNIDGASGIPTRLEQGYYFIHPLISFQTRILDVRPNSTGYLVTGIREPVCPLLIDFCIARPDLWATQLDPFGTPLWTKIVNANGYSSGTSISATSDGGSIVAGETASFFSSPFVGPSQGLVVKFNSQGGEIWQKVYGDFTGEPHSIIYPSASGGYILARTVRTPTGKRGQTQADFLIMNLDQSGAMNLDCPLDRNSSFTISNADLLSTDLSVNSVPTDATLKTPNVASINMTGAVRTLCQSEATAKLSLQKR
jgi:hypothetical protein